MTPKSNAIATQTLNAIRVLCLLRAEAADLSRSCQRTLRLARRFRSDRAFLNKNIPL